MKIAYILTSLANRGPVIVVNDIVSVLSKDKSVEIKIFYFKNIVELNFPVPVEQVSFFDKDFLQGFDIVHTNGLLPDLYCLFNKSKSNCKFVSTMHNIIFQEYKSNYNTIVARIIEFFWILSLKRHDKIVCLTNIMYRYYKGLLKNKNLCVINNGRNLSSSFKVISSQENAFFSDLSKKFKIIGTGCVVTKRKGLHQIIESLPLLEGYCFVLFGEGPELNNLKALADNCKVADRCFFMGYRNNAADYYNFFDMFVISSYSEGLPLALLEAAGNKLPTLCSNIDIHKELFNNNEVSFFDLDNKDSFVKAVHYLFENLDAFSEEIYKRYLKSYTCDIMSSNYFKLYEHL